MESIVVNGIHCHWDFKLLPDDFIAITLFGHVFFNTSKKKMQSYLLSERGAITLNHERIHILQANTFKTKWLGFYVYYLWYWVLGLFRHGTKDNKSYYNIPFEREAEYNEENFDYNKSDWKKYIY